MEQKLTWDELLARKHEFIGKDMVTFESGRIFRGPLTDIQKRGDSIYFSTKWTATKKEGCESDLWELYSNPSVQLNTKGFQDGPLLRDNGSLFFSLPYIGTVEILSSTEGNLDLNQVNLPPTLGKELI